MRTLRALLLSAATLLTISTMSAALAADIGLSPARISLSVPPGGTTSAEVTLFSNSSSSVPLTVSVGDWVQASDGKLSFLPEGAAPHSASNWLVPSVSTLSVAPGGMTTVRVTVNVPNDSSLAGTYQSIVYFATQPKATSSVRGAKFVTRQRLGLIVYVTVAGTATKGSTLSDMYRDGKTLKVVVGNKGNSLMRATGKVEIRDATGKTVATLPIEDEAVMRESDREIALALPKDLAPGYYVALALIQDSRGGSLAGQLPFTLGN